MIKKRTPPLPPPPRIFIARLYREREIASRQLVGCANFWISSLYNRGTESRIVDRWSKRSFSLLRQNWIFDVRGTADLTPIICPPLIMIINRIIKTWLDIWHKITLVILYWNTYAQYTVYEIIKKWSFHPVFNVLSRYVRIYFSIILSYFFFLSNAIR